MSKNLTKNNETAKKYGVHEINLSTSSVLKKPYLDIDFKVTFYDQNGKEFNTKGFYDGKNLFKARRSDIQTLFACGEKK